MVEILRTARFGHVEATGAILPADEQRWNEYFGHRRAHGALIPCPFHRRQRPYGQVTVARRKTASMISSCRLVIVTWYVCSAITSRSAAASVLTPSTFTGSSNSTLRSSSDSVYG